MDGDVIKVYADQEIVAAEENVFVISGKAITIDLNGKTINVTLAENNVTKFVFTVKADAGLTLTGEGSVVANGEGKLYYMFYNAGTTTVAGGNYTLYAANGGAIFT